MSRDRPIQNPDVRDEMSDLIRTHARTAIQQAILAELNGFRDKQDETDPQGRRNVVRNGDRPGRQVLTGVGPVSVQLPNQRHRAGPGRSFRSLLRPSDLKKAGRVETVSPWPCPKGASIDHLDPGLLDNPIFPRSDQPCKYSNCYPLHCYWAISA